MDGINWLAWDDLTDAEKEQARESYIAMREIEEGRDRDETTQDYPEPIDGDAVMGCRFERMEDGYIYVDL